MQIFGPFFLFFISNIRSISLFNIDEAEDIISFTFTIFHNVHKTWEIFGPTEETPNWNFETKQKKILANLAEVSSMVRKIERELPQISTNTIRGLEYKISDIVHLENKLGDLVKHVSAIEQTYETFIGFEDTYHYLNEPLPASSELDSMEFHIYNKSRVRPDLEIYTIQSFINSIVSFEGSSIRNRLHDLHEMMVPRIDVTPLTTPDNILVLINKHLQAKGQLRCNVKQSPQQLLYNLFTSLTLTEMKGYIMMQFSYMVLRLFQKGQTFKTESAELRRLMKRRLKDQAVISKEIITRADNALWRCDPEYGHQSGRTYTELTRLLQGYIQNEVDLNKEKSCLDGCSAYTHAQQVRCTKDTFCTEQEPCKGNLINCHTVDPEMWICQSDPTSYRRYEWIRAGNGHLYGKEDRCTTSSSRVNSWRKFLFWRCLYCLCMCDEETSLSDRYFNLQETTTSIHENKIVTGVRFVKHNRIIHLQIKEGKLNARGNVTYSDWIPVSGYTIDSSNVTEGIDYHTLKYHARYIDLDELKAPENHVLTGTKFRMVGNHLNLEIRVTPFNFTTGQIFPELSYWISNDNTNVDLDPLKTRKEYKLKGKRLPTDSKFTEPGSSSNQYTEFTHSDEDTDVAQSTVPFIDTQPVDPEPPLPIVGLTLLVKDAPLTAGYLAPQVFTYNLFEQVETKAYDKMDKLIK